MKDRYGTPIHPGFDIVYGTRRGSSLTLRKALVLCVYDDCIKVRVKDGDRITHLRAMGNVVVI